MSEPGPGLTVGPTGAGPSETMRRLFSADPIAAALGVELVATAPDSVTLRLTVDERHLGGHGRCHGGVLFTLADIAMSLVGNRAPGQAFATHAAIDFVGPVQAGATVEAVGVETVQRGRAAVHDVIMRVDGEVVGVFRGNTLRVG